MEYCDFLMRIKGKKENVEELNKLCGTKFTQEDWDNAYDYISVDGIEREFNI